MEMQDETHRFLSLMIVGIGVAWFIAVSACCGNPETDDHGGDDSEAHAEGRFVHVEPDMLDELGIRIEIAQSGSVGLIVELPGEVQVNGDRMAHVAPRVGGVVEEVFASLGDSVRRGQLLAVLESRELADAKAVFLAAAERLKLADATFRREERLWKDKVSSEQDYLDARRGLAEARIERRAAEQKLHALGFSQDELDGLGDRHDAEFTVYRLTAPFDGTDHRPPHHDRRDRRQRITRVHGGGSRNGVDRSLGLPARHRRGQGGPDRPRGHRAR